MRKTIKQKEKSLKHFDCWLLRRTRPSHRNKLPLRSHIPIFEWHGLLYQKHSMYALKWQSFAYKNLCAMLLWGNETWGYMNERNNQIFRFEEKTLNIWLVWPHQYVDGLLKTWMKFGWNKCAFYDWFWSFMEELFLVIYVIAKPTFVCEFVGLEPNYLRLRFYAELSKHRFKIIRRFYCRQEPQRQEEIILKFTKKNSLKIFHQKTQSNPT